MPKGMQRANPSTVDKNAKWVIYSVVCECSPNEVRYIGLSTGAIRVRINNHSNQILNRPFSHWIHKHLKLEHKIEFLIEARTLDKNIDTLADLEKEWIVFYRLKGHRLLNVAEGGQGTIGVVKNNKISKAAVWDVLYARHVDKIPINELMRTYGVVYATIQNILIGKTWHEVFKSFNIAYPDYTTYSEIYTLDEKKSLDIFRLHFIDMKSSRELAALFNVSVSAIDHVIFGRAFPSVRAEWIKSGKPIDYTRKKGNNSKYKINVGQIIELRNVDTSLTTFKELEQKYNVTRTSIELIMKGKTYKGLTPTLQRMADACHVLVSRQQRLDRKRNHER